MRQTWRTLLACTLVTGTALGDGGRAIDVVTIDGATQQCTWLAATAESVALRCPEPTDLPIDQTHSIVFSPDEVTPGDTHPPIQFHLADGGLFRGRLAAGRGEAIVVNTSFADELVLDLTSLAAMWFDRDDESGEARALFDELSADRLPGKDVLLFEREGRIETVRGGLISLGPEQGRFMFNRKERSFQIEKVLAIVLATGIREAAPLPVEVRLLEGARFTGKLRRGDSSSIVVSTSFGAELTLSLDSLASVHFESPRVRYLSSLSPTRSVADGLLDEPLPARFDRSVSNGPIRMNGIEFGRGIGVHARSEIDYDLNGEYEQLVAMIGIDDAVRPRGNVTFRVLADNVVVFESGPVTGRDDPQRIHVNLEGVDSLALVVDYGDHLDLSDHADWGDARLIRPPTGKTSP